MSTAADQRKSLHTIQFSSKTQRQLIGRNGSLEINKKSVIKVYEDTVPQTNVSNKSVRKNDGTKTEETQTENVMVLDPVEMMTSEETSPEYYRLLAEQRRIALEKTLEENMNLHNLVHSLEEELKIVKEERDLLKPLAEEAEKLAEILKVLTEEEEEPSNSAEDEVLAVPLEGGD